MQPGAKGSSTSPMIKAAQYAGTQQCAGSGQQWWRSGGRMSSMAPHAPDHAEGCVYIYIYAFYAMELALSASDSAGACGVMSLCPHPALTCSIHGEVPGLAALACSGRCQGATEGAHQTKSNHICLYVKPPYGACGRVHCLGPPTRQGAALATIVRPTAALHTTLPQNASPLREGRNPCCACCVRARLRLQRAEGAAAVPPPAADSRRRCSP